jgi:acetyltransferase
VVKPIVVFSSSPSAQVGDALRRFGEDRIPVFRSPSRAARALAVLTRYRRAQAIGLDAGPDAPVEPATEAYALLGHGAPGACLSERDSKSLLEAAGIPVTRDRLLRVGEPIDIAKLSPPLVVKVVSADISHKTEAGGVMLGIDSQERLDQAIERVQANALRYAPHARIEGILVSEMIRGGFELIAGVVNDEVFGPVVVVGAGGIHAEVLRDSSCRLAPFDEAAGREMLDELRCRPILDGVRGAPALDVEAAARVLAALSRFAWAQRSRIGEIDINPLFLLPDRVVAADALVVLAGK